ncbi:MAG: hypothetical protein U0175_12590 [Caldilineaceae bacterium]
MCVVQQRAFCEIQIDFALLQSEIAKGEGRLVVLQRVFLDGVKSCCRHAQSIGGEKNDLVRQQKRSSVMGWTFCSNAGSTGSDKNSFCRTAEGFSAMAD